MEQSFKNLESPNNPALVIDYNHKIIAANLMLSKFLNKPLEKIIGDYCYNAITCELCFKECPFLKVFEHNDSFEKKNINIYDELGTTKLINYNIVPYEFDNIRGALITIVPIEKDYINLEKSTPILPEEINITELYEKAFDMLDEGIIFVDKNYKIFECNTFMENLTGFTKADLIGNPCPKICHLPEGYNCPFDYCYKKNKPFEELFSVITRKNALPVLVKAQLKIFKNASNSFSAGIAIIKKILDFNRLKKEYPLEDIITQSNAMKEAISLLAIAGISKKHFLITGEPGVGKKFFASKLKLFYENKDIPYYTLNTKGLTEGQIEKELFGFEKDAFIGAFDTKKGLIEKANNGILVIHDITELSPYIQEKLYITLKTGKLYRIGSNNPITISVQIVAITTKDIKYLLEKKLFDKNLYEMISSINIKIPPLRERKEDLKPLIEHFLNTFKEGNKRKQLSQISESTLNLLSQYHWAGNVFELKNVIEHIYYVAPSTKQEITPEMIPQSIREAVTNTLKTKSTQEEREQIIKVLRQTNLNRSETSKILGYSRITLWRKIKQYNITIEELLNY
jgi:PAS domain S-box-containing protein